MTLQNAVKGRRTSRNYPDEPRQTERRVLWPVKCLCTVRCADLPPAPKIRGRMLSWRNPRPKRRFPRRSSYCAAFVQPETRPLSA